MQEKKLFPFKRNRFYPGKLLSSYDFIAEQRYFGDKRRFLNRAVFGAGVAFGMRVYKIDDFSIMIESGFALDFGGRELVLEKDEIKRLFTIDGFTKTTSRRLSLHICYREEQITPVFAVDKQEQGEKLEYNHIAEGCRLFLTDLSDRDAKEAEPDFILCKTIAQDKHYRITLESPGYACRGLSVCPVVRVRKLSDEESGLSFSARLQAPAFACRSGDTLRIELKAGALKQGESHCLRTQLVPRNGFDAASLFFEAGQVSVTLGGNPVALRDDICIPIRIGDLPPEQMIRESVSRIPLEGLFEYESGSLRLAEITVIRNGESCVIDTVREAASHVTGTPFQQKYFDEYIKYYAPVAEKPQTRTEMAVASTASLPSREKTVTTGVAEIPLGLKTRTGEVFYSDHIIHQLGAGNVFVSAGPEFIKHNEAGDASQLTVYGDSTLFENTGISIQTAVCVDATRGTFRIAVRLLEQVDSLFLTMRWVAVRLPEAERYAAPTTDAVKRVFASPATKVLSPREKWAIHMQFEGMHPMACRFEVIEANGGNITSDGVYTAPNTEGVYDIKVSVVGEPNLTAYAYAVVRRKEDGQ